MEEGISCALYPGVIARKMQSRKYIGERKGLIEHCSTMRTSSKFGRCTPDSGSSASFEWTRNPLRKKSRFRFDAGEG
jgi:hypothetical protein